MDGWSWSSQLWSWSIWSRWMNGSGRGALLFESEGRWRTEVGFKCQHFCSCWWLCCLAKNCFQFQVKITIRVIYIFLDPRKVYFWDFNTLCKIEFEQNPGVEQGPGLRVWGSSRKILRFWDAGYHHQHHLHHCQHHLYLHCRRHHHHQVCHQDKLNHPCCCSMTLPIHF